MHLFESESEGRCISRKSFIMKNRSLVIVFLLSVLFSTGCDWKRIRGNGHIRTETRPVSAFTRVVSAGFFQMEWHPGPPSFSLTTDENLIPRIKTTMEGDILRIK